MEGLNALDHTKDIKLEIRSYQQETWYSRIQATFDEVIEFVVPMKGQVKRITVTQNQAVTSFFIFLRQLVKTAIFQIFIFGAYCYMNI